MIEYPTEVKSNTMIICYFFFVEKAFGVNFMIDIHF